MKWVTFLPESLQATRTAYLINGCQVKSNFSIWLFVMDILDIDIPPELTSPYCVLDNQQLVGMWSINQP